MIHESKLTKNLGDLKESFYLGTSFASFGQSSPSRIRASPLRRSPVAPRIPGDRPLQKFRRSARRLQCRKLSKVIGEKWPRVIGYARASYRVFLPRSSLIVCNLDWSSLCCLALAPILYSRMINADIKMMRPRLLATNTNVAVFRSGYRSILGK